MTELLEMALEEVRKLPPEKQDQAARDVVGGAVEEVYILSGEENVAIDIELEQLDRGEFATEVDVAATFAKYRAK